MSVVQKGDLYIATRVTGPTHNFLGLDFARDLEEYTRDLADSPAETTELIDSIRRQVGQVLCEAQLDASDLCGIQFDSGDTPSDSVYVELTREILEARAS